LRLFSDAAHRRLVEPLLAKEFESGFKNSAAGCLCLSLRLLRCRSFEHVQLHSWPKDESCQELFERVQKTGREAGCAAGNLTAAGEDLPEGRVRLPDAN